jgi:hypothetical protein
LKINNVFPLRKLGVILRELCGLTILTAKAAKDSQRTAKQTASVLQSAILLTLAKSLPYLSAVDARKATELTELPDSAIQSNSQLVLMNWS